MRNTEIRCKNTKKNVNTQIINVKILIFNKIFCFQVERRMKCISLLFRLSDSYNFPASLTSRFRKTVQNGSFLKLYIPTTLKFDRKAENPPLAPFTSVLHKEQSAATVCIRQHALAETDENNRYNPTRVCHKSVTHKPLIISLIPQHYNLIFFIST